MRTCALFLGIGCGITLSLLQPSTSRAQGMEKPEAQSLDRARELFDTIYAKYSSTGTSLLRENYPHDNAYRAGYLADSNAQKTNAYAYLWPFSGTLSAANALYASTGDTAFLGWIHQRILPGLDAYFDDQRQPAAYASYIRSKGLSDRFYDDNIWLGIDFAELFLLSGGHDYLNRAKQIWSFVMSGVDDRLGGGVYWCEQKKESKNACSNAPAAVFALRMFEATGDSLYLRQGEEWYGWTKKWLQDPDDGLYWDNVNLNGKVDKRKYPYNSGQMLQAAAMLFNTTGHSEYLEDAKRIAESGYRYFFEEIVAADGMPRNRLKPSDNWFIAVMMRGYLELFDLDRNPVYLNAFAASLDDAWTYGRSKEGLFGKRWRNPQSSRRWWLLDQAALVEMYARMAGAKLF